ncbi:hypothetical protein WICPIJ_004704 [Wickerhamomyces pijperi]|uniref:D-lactate dehydrogenase (cytochrome) n=1 Tax=Wickerhamomyces pijperi TaxID=599730 RepID=A0A9P8Q7I8_WICPI|nr:hypothetical protein WICPIJ_004704 [Wickerhamomyces pijperi]
MFARSVKRSVPRRTPSFFKPRFNSTKPTPTTPASGSSKSSLLYPSLFFAAGIAATFGYFKLFPAPAPIKTNSTTKLSDLGPIEYGSEEDFQQAIKEITELLGQEHISTLETSLDAHNDTFFQTHHPLPGQRPRVIVYPGSTEEVSKVLKIIHKYKVPVVPFSGGTSLEGQFIASRSGISLDVTRLDKIVEFNAKDLDITVQAAVGWQDLAEYLNPHGLLFGPDPGPGAHISGMCSTNCSGTNAARYGTMKDNVLSLTIVLPDGTIVKTKKRPRKSSAGYNLTGLFIGAEGTLGVITEITLKLHVKPEQETIAVVNFNSVTEATDAVSAIFAKGIQLNAMEMLDTNMMKCINFAGTTNKTWKEVPTLFLKIGGSPVILKELIKSVKEITKASGATGFEFASTEEEKEELWSARKAILWSSIDYAKHVLNDQNTKAYITDVAVPVSRLSKVIAETQKDLDDCGLTHTVLGHVGDGNFHALVLYREDEAKEVKMAVDRLVERALANEGTCTGEHGVGVGKREYLLKEVGEEGIDLMRQIKLAIDPLRLFNADKVFKIDPTEHIEH